MWDMHMLNVVALVHEDPRLKLHAFNAFYCCELTMILMSIGSSIGWRIWSRIRRLRMLDIEYLLSSCTLLLDAALCPDCATKSVRVTLRAEKLLFHVVCPFWRTWRSNDKSKTRRFPSISLGQTVNLIMVGDRRECCMNNHDCCTAVYFGSSDLNGLWQCPASQHDRFVGICI